MTKELKSILEEEEKQRAAAGREKEETISRVKGENIDIMFRVQEENKKRMKKARADAEEKENRLVLESGARVAKALAEQKALFEVLRTKQRQEEEDDIE